LHGFIAGLLIAGISLSTPFLLAALGELFAERAGVINVGIEGMVLVGAFCGFAASFFSHSAWIGALGAAGGGIVFAGLFALVAVGFKADQVVAGTAVNILAVGITGVFNRALFAEAGSSATPFPNINVPLLDHLPLLGPALFTQNALGYFGWLSVPAAYWYLYQTKPGLRLRSVGEYPAAAESAGVHVNRTRVLAVLFAGAMAGLAGAYLSIGYTNAFIENMSKGYGFIALAVVILGRWNPVGTLLAALMFGIASALQSQLSVIKSPLPYQVFQALPYVITLVTLMFRAAGRAGGPAALGQPHERA